MRNKNVALWNKIHGGEIDKILILCILLNREISPHFSN